MVIELKKKPEAVGFSTESLQRLGAWQQKLADTEAMPFTQVLIARKGEPIYFHSTGYQDVARKIPIQENSIVRMYSMTKPIVSVALMKLYERGLFQLSDPVHVYLGKQWKRQNMSVYVSGTAEDGYETVACERSITIDMVLTHTSGLSYGFDRLGLENQLDPVYHKEGLFSKLTSKTLGEFVDRLAGMPLLFQPGQGWNYGYNVEVVGRLVEVLSGQSIDEFLRKEILEPLEMHDTSFTLQPSKSERLCVNYMRKGGSIGMIKYERDPSASGLEEVLDGRRYSPEYKFFEAGGGLLGTMEDYFNFTQMLLNGGVFKGKRILSRKTIEWMTVNHLPHDLDMKARQSIGGYGEVATHGNGFGLGFSVVVDSAKSKQMLSTGTFGWGGAASTTFWVDPMEDIVVIFLSQLMFRDDLLLPYRAQLIQLVYGCLIDDLDAKRERLRPLPTRSNL